jgi:hypothetical protein
MSKISIKNFKIPLLRQISIPLCDTCKYSIKIALSNSEYLVCKKFSKNITNNISYYPLASYCRKEEKKCGFLGKKYIPI